MTDSIMRVLRASLGGGQSVKDAVRENVGTQNEFLNQILHNFFDGEGRRCSGLSGEAQIRLGVLSNCYLFIHDFIFLVFSLTIRRIMTGIVVNPVFMGLAVGMVWAQANCSPSIMFVCWGFTFLLLGLPIGIVIQERGDLATTVLFGLGAIIHLIALMLSLPAYLSMVHSLELAKRSRAAERAAERDQGVQMESRVQAMQIETAAVAATGAGAFGEAQPAPEFAGDPDAFPQAFLCPISKEPMQHPVLTMGGNTYEKANIELWLKHHDTDPVTGAKLTSKNLIPNNALLSQISSFIQEQRDAEYGQP